jgi:hypothetical protein
MVNLMYDQNLNKLMVKSCSELSSLLFSEQKVENFPALERRSAAYVV